MVSMSILSAPTLTVAIFGQATQILCRGAINHISISEQQSELTEFSHLFWLCDIIEE